MSSAIKFLVTLSNLHSSPLLKSNCLDYIVDHYESITPDDWFELNRIPQLSYEAMCNFVAKTKIQRMESMLEYME